MPCTTWQERTDKNAGVLQTKTRESSGRASIPAYLGRYLVQAIHCTELGVPWPSWSEENGDHGPARPRRRDRAGRTNCRLAIGWHQSHTNSKLLESIDEWRSRSAGFLPARVASSHASMPRASKRRPGCFRHAAPGSCPVLVECPSRRGGFGVSVSTCQPLSFWDRHSDWKLRAPSTTPHQSLVKGPPIFAAPASPRAGAASWPLAFAFTFTIAALLLPARAQHPTRIIRGHGAPASGLHQVPQRLSAVQAAASKSE